MSFMQDYVTGPNLTEESQKVEVEALYASFRLWCDGQPSHVKAVDKRVMVKDIKNSLGLESKTIFVQGRKHNPKGYVLSKSDVEKRMRAARLWDDLI